VQDRKPTVGQIVLYVFGNGEPLPMLITKVYDDTTIGGQVFLSPSAFEQQRDAWTKAYGFLAPHPTAALMDRIAYSHTDGPVAEGEPAHLHRPNTWHWPEP
jgi:hypothetical protein